MRPALELAWSHLTACSILQNILGIVQNRLDLGDVAKINFADSNSVCAGVACANYIPAHQAERIGNLAAKKAGAAGN